MPVQPECPNREHVENICATLRGKGLVVETDGERLFCKADSSSTFRYIVEFDSNKEYHGYDMDMGFVTRPGTYGSVRLAGRVLTDHEVQFDKSEAIHMLVIETLSAFGFEYRKPSVRFMPVKEPMRMTYRALGLMFGGLGIISFALFFVIKSWLGFLVSGLFKILGIWALGVSLGRPWVPVLSIKKTDKTAVLSFAVGWGLALLALFLLVFLYDGPV